MAQLLPQVKEPSFLTSSQTNRLGRRFISRQFMPGQGGIQDVAVDSAPPVWQQLGAGSRVEIGQHVGVSGKLPHLAGTMFGNDGRQSFDRHHD